MGRGLRNQNAMIIPALKRLLGKTIATHSREVAGTLMEGAVLWEAGRGPTFEGGWVEVCYSADKGAHLHRLQLYVQHGEGRYQSRTALPPLAAGATRWVGRLNGPIQRLRLAALSPESLSDLCSFSIRQLGYAELLGRCFLRSPWRTLRLLRLYISGQLIEAFYLLRDLLNVSRAGYYADWIARNEVHEPEQIMAEAQSWTDKPSFFLVVSTDGEPDALRRTLASLGGQLYDQWRACLLVRDTTPAATRELVTSLSEQDPRIATMAEVQLASLQLGYVAGLQCGDVLSPVALHSIARRLVLSPSAEIVYTDEDTIRGGVRDEPTFKPRWNEELFLAHDYIGGLRVFRAASFNDRELIERLAGPSAYEVTLQRLRTTPEAAIHHVPEVLFHRRAGSLQVDEELRHREQKAIVALLAERGEAVRVEMGPYETSRIVRSLPDPAPGVSLIVPTRDRLELLEPCVDGLLSRTDYPALEVIIVDNGSEEPSTLRYLRRMSANVRVQVLRHDGPFNYSTLNNMGARAARGSILGLINNDIEVMEIDWLKEMVVQAIRPRIGAVGAKLLYADGRVQHAGVIVGLGGYAGHSHRFFDAHAAGYQKRLASPQYLSAVTAACLVVEARKYWEVGGLDESAFAVAYNDVDFCLKLGAAGYKNVYTPYATLFHLESASRGLDLTGEKLARYEREKAALLDRWWPIVRDDPFYNPNLTRTYEDFSLGE